MLRTNNRRETLLRIVLIITVVGVGVLTIFVMILRRAQEMGPKPTASPVQLPATWTPTLIPTRTSTPTTTPIPPTPTPAGDAVDDQFYIEKCHRWQNVKLDVLENDSLESGMFDEIILIQDIYYYDENNQRVERNHGSGSFADFPYLVVRLSQNEIGASGAIDPENDLYYVDYRVEGPKGQISNVATVTMIVNEPMPNSWCRDVHARTNTYHLAKSLSGFDDDEDLDAEEQTECEAKWLEWLAFYTEIQKQETNIINRVNREEENRTHDINTYYEAGVQTRELYDRVMAYEHKEHECVTKFNTHLAMEIHYLLSAFNNAYKSNVYEAQSDFYKNDEIRAELGIMIASELPEGWDQ